MSVAERRKLSFASAQDVIAEIARLRAGGYTRLGNWSLEQICWHLGRAIPLPIPTLPADPPPRQVPDVIARFRHYVEHGAPPPGAQAPPGTEPPDAVGPDVFDDLAARLRAAEAFDGDFVDFGPRGAVPRAVYWPFIRAHCGHHLSYLVPDAGGRS